MPRVLLLIPTTSYRTQAFLGAARWLGVEITVGSERPNVLAHTNPSGLLTVSIADNTKAAATVTEFAKKFPLDAVVGIDDQTVVAAAAISTHLGLRHNSIGSVAAAHNKHTMREFLSNAGILQPHYSLFCIKDDPASVGRFIVYPCVVKPLTLAGSRGVIRANDEAEFVTAFRRIAAILQSPDVGLGRDGQEILVENFIPGKEVALEGLLSNGKLRVLSIFDKPDPLDGPFFEETIYVSPSRRSFNIQEKISSVAQQATQALGLQEGPVHAELRINEEGVWVIEIAARSIGGFCSRALRFTEDGKTDHAVSLEELILRHALGRKTTSLHLESRASGVMMIPVPKAGVLEEVHRLQDAKAVRYIEDIIISVPPGEKIVPLPEGNKYLGFIFGRADSPENVEFALREAHRRLQFSIV